MRGFRIKFRSEEIVVTPDFRSSVTIFYNSSNGYELSVAGIKGFGDDALDTFWIKSDMHIGESIEIEIINADEQVCSSPTCVKKLDPNPLKLSEKQKQQMLTEYLKDFYLLEAQYPQKQSSLCKLNHLYSKKFYHPKYLRQYMLIHFHIYYYKQKLHQYDRTEYKTMIH